MANKVLCLRFNGNLQDESGNENHGTLQGEGQFVEGRRGQALYLDRAGFVTFPLNPVLDIKGPLTIRATVMIHSNWDAHQGIIGLGGNYGNSAALSLYHSLSIIDPLTAPAWTPADPLVFARPRFTININFGGSGDLQIIPLIPLGQWVDLGAVYTGDTLKAFINGSKVAEQPTDISALSGGADVAVGTVWGAGKLAHMTIDELEVWDGALSDWQMERKWITWLAVGGVVGVLGLALAARKR